MEQIAFIVGDRFIYWSSIILTLAAAASGFLFLGLYLQDREDRVLPGTCLLPLAAVLSLILSRLIHWYCLPDNYLGFFQALTQFHHGGYALVGVVAGCLLAALVLKWGKVCKDLPDMLDCMAIAGTAGIAVGRLESAFNATDRGMVLSEKIPFPWVYPVINAVTGEPDYRLATFAIEAIVTGIIAVALYGFYRKYRDKPSYRPGDTALLFAMLYSSGEVVLDSTRYDSLYFRSNGFVSMLQVFGAVALVAVVVVFSIRMVKKQGLRKKLHLPLWGGMLALVGLAGYMEYYVQRHASYAGMCYSVMSLCLGGVIAGALYIRYLAQGKTEEKEKA